MIKGYCKRHWNHECLAIVMMCYISNKFLKTSQNLPLNFGYFHFSVSASTLLTSSWLVILVSAESRRTILSIDRSEPRFESHKGEEEQQKF